MPPPTSNMLVSFVFLVHYANLRTPRGNIAVYGTQYDATGYLYHTHIHTLYTHDVKNWMSESFILCFFGFCHCDKLLIADSFLFRILCWGPQQTNKMSVHRPSEKKKGSITLGENRKGDIVWGWGALEQRVATQRHGDTQGHVRSYS